MPLSLGLQWKHNWPLAVMSTSKKINVTKLPGSLQADTSYAMFWWGQISKQAEGVKSFHGVK